MAVTKSQSERMAEIERNKNDRIFLARAILSDHIPLCGGIPDIITRPPYHLIRMNKGPISIYLHHGGRNVAFYDLVSDDEGYLQYIEVQIQDRLPSTTFPLARTALNQLLDNLQGVKWLPLLIMRIDLYVKGDNDPLAHQLIYPFMSELTIGPLGGMHQYPAFSMYEAVLREAIISTSPYYRFLCSYRLYEGLNKLRKWLKDLCQHFGINEKLPKDPPVNIDLIRSYNFRDSFIVGLTTIGDLWSKFKEDRNRVAHFFLKDDDNPLNFSNGYTYNDYSMISAILLYHSNIAFTDLLGFFNKNLMFKMSKGSILPLAEEKDKFILKSQA